MSFQFVVPELARWDALAAAPDRGPELLVAPLFIDERPLRGVAGLCDWRMCGRLSRHVASGRITGALGETTLMPAQRLWFRWLLLLGLGSSSELGESQFREAVRAIARATAHLKRECYAVALPGLHSGHIGARRALELWIEEVGEAGEIWLVEPLSTQKDLAEVLARRAPPAPSTAR